MTAKPQLLIVEDDLDLSEMISSYFRVQNYEVLTVAWGAEALKVADESHLDLIMLDVRLPDIDGFELCRKLREARKTKDTPILFLTEKRDRVDKLTGLELGVVDYITKPFDLQELGLRIRNAITRSNQPSSTHRVTDFAEGRLVDEKLSELMNRTDDWAVVHFAIPSLDTFRENYGFVAADDVLRALALMVQNAVREFGTNEDFIGHLTNDEVVIITKSDNAEEIYDRVFRRINQSREYFYPFKDRERIKKAVTEKHLRFSGGTLEKPSTAFRDLSDLKDSLNKVLEEK
jgi:PleD family two-component response regulator